MMEPVSVAQRNSRHQTFSGASARPRSSDGRVAMRHGKLVSEARWCRDPHSAAVEHGRTAKNHHVNGLGQPCSNCPLRGGRRHTCNQLPPLSMLDMDVQSSVGHDFDGTLCKQKVDQHPICCARYPQTRSLLNIIRARSRKDDGGANGSMANLPRCRVGLSAMRLLATGDSFL